MIFGQSETDTRKCFQSISIHSPARKRLLVAWKDAYARIITASEYLAVRLAKGWLAVVVAAFPVGNVLVNELLLVPGRDAHNKLDC